jgi:trans-aconitate methyltransferase
MTLLDEFNEKFGFKIGVRAKAFEKIITHINHLRHDNFTIIETGTAREKDNWCGDGQSTLIWDWVLGKYPNAKGISIDIDREAIELAASQTSRISYGVGDSVFALNNLDWSWKRDCKVLYLDSFDLDKENPLPSSFHHMKEMVSIFGALPSGCLVAVDDCVSDKVGKHLYVKAFFDSIGIEPFLEGYITAWIK